MTSKILVVDDNPVALDSMEGILKREGYDLFFASNGKEALKEAEKVKPDLILLDVMMPGMDGFEVCRIIRKTPVLSEVPVVLVTALDDLDSLLEGIEAGADDFISKPYNIAELRTRVKTITKLNRYRQLLEERTKFEWVVEKANDGYLMLNDREEIIYANPKAKHYLCFPHDKNIPTEETFMEAAKKEYLFKPEGAWASGLQNSKGPLFLLRPEKEQSSQFWLRVEQIEMSESSEGFLIRLQDVTENIISRDKIWKFHNLITHKLTTPLAAIESILEIFRIDASLFSPDEGMQSLVGDAYRSTLSIKNQIKKILRFARSRELLNPVFGKSSLKDIIDIINELKIRMKIDDIEVYSEDIDRPEDINLTFSLPAVEMLIRELFVNSRKFHPENSPSITVAISPVSNGIKLQFSDDGTSLSPEELLKMWEPYYQEEKHLMSELSGLGLGLPTIASMVWAAGGDCRSYNREEGAGIVIEIILPAE